MDFKIRFDLNAIVYNGKNIVDPSDWIGQSKLIVKKFKTR
jgi:hypothetical protein